MEQEAGRAGDWLSMQLVEEVAGRPGPETVRAKPVLTPHINIYFLSWFTKGQMDD